MPSPELAELEEIRALIASARQLGALTYGEVATAVAGLVKGVKTLLWLETVVARGSASIAGCSPSRT